MCLLPTIAGGIIERPTPAARPWRLAVTLPAMSPTASLSPAGIHSRSVSADDLSRVKAATLHAGQLGASAGAAAADNLRIRVRVEPVRLFLRKMVEADIGRVVD
jgi:hypothetical protein